MSENWNGKQKNPYRYEARKLQRELGIKYTTALRMVEAQNAERESHEE